MSDVAATFRSVSLIDLVEMGRATQRNIGVGTARCRRCAHPHSLFLIKGSVVDPPPLYFTTYVCFCGCRHGVVETAPPPPAKCCDETKHHHHPTVVLPVNDFGRYGEPRCSGCPPLVIGSSIPPGELTVTSGPVTLGPDAGPITVQRSDIGTRRYLHPHCFGCIYARSDRCCF